MWIAVIMAERVPDKLGRWVLPCVLSSTCKFDLTENGLSSHRFSLHAHLRSSLMQFRQPSSHWKPVFIGGVEDACVVKAMMSLVLKCY